MSYREGHAHLGRKALPEEVLSHVLSAGVPFSYNGERPSYFSPLTRFNQADRGTSEKELRATYEWTHGFYRTLGAEQNFETDRAAGFAQPISPLVRPLG